MGFLYCYRAEWRAPFFRQAALSCTCQHRFVPVSGQTKGYQYESQRGTKEKQRLDLGKERCWQADRKQDSLRSHANLYSETASSFSLRINWYFSHLLSSWMSLHQEEATTIRVCPWINCSEDWGATALQRLHRGGVFDTTTPSTSQWSPAHS